MTSALVLALVAMQADAFSGRTRRKAYVDLNVPTRGGLRVRAPGGGATGSVPARVTRLVWPSLG